MNTSSPRPERPVREQLLLECRAMAQYALAAGMKVPQDLVARLDRIERLAHPEKPPAGAAPSVPPSQVSSRATSP
ncbi:MAG: hypothetical protein AAF560_27565, partial [Acidobacteriota bacterium]